MVVTRRGNGKKGNRRQNGRRKGGIEKITIQGERDKEQEVTIHHEAVSQKKASLAWSWHEEFATEWSKTFILKK